MTYQASNETSGVRSLPKRGTAIITHKKERTRRGYFLDFEPVPYARKAAFDASLILITNPGTFMMYSLFLRIGKDFDG